LKNFIEIGIPLDWLKVTQPDNYFVDQQSVRGDRSYLTKLPSWYNVNDYEPDNKDDEIEEVIYDKRLWNKVLATDKDTRIWFSKANHNLEKDGPLENPKQK
jgi:hypothetical protein